ncbi:HIT family protein [Spiroplasma endosymbiont of Crioceris asparagi]|uniref:HIT family protein n=1 Tax=Spiroplasma endosymbiont of Crioceris asparagi TaxID=3066286 RepID=UPI0030CDE4FE
MKTCNLKADCLFCKIIKKEVPSFLIKENDYAYAFLDIYPNSVGHTLVIPKSHYDDYSSCDDQYLFEVSKLAKEVAILLKTKLKDIKGFNYVVNEKAIASQVVFHYHMHVVPKYEKSKGFGFIINDAPTNLDLEEIKNKIIN